MNEIRQHNLTLIAGRYPSQRVLADLLGYSPGYLNQLITGHRSIGEKVARKIEVLTKKQFLWLDIWHSLENETSLDNNITDSPIIKGRVPLISSVIDGEVYAMGGASRSHNIISSNVARILGNHLENTRYTTFSSAMKVKANNCFFYPDVMVVCDDDKGDEYFTDAPVIIVEVLSKSTRRLDKVTKMAIYKTIPSLQEYVLIEQDVVDVEVCRRSNGWVSQHYFLGDDATFEAIDITLSIADIYHRVNNEDMLAYIAQIPTDNSPKALTTE